MVVEEVQKTLNQRDDEVTGHVPETAQELVALMRDGLVAEGIWTCKETPNFHSNVG